MTIDEIMKMWGEDSHIDDTDLDNESLNIPNVHQKYLDIYSLESSFSAKVGSGGFQKWKSTRS